jgi:hypothetical protein
MNSALLDRERTSFPCPEVSHDIVRLFQKRFMRTKCDIYVVITITWSIPLLVNY